MSPTDCRGRVSDQLRQALTALLVLYKSFTEKQRLHDLVAGATICGFPKPRLQQWHWNLCQIRCMVHCGNHSAENPVYLVSNVSTSWPPYRMYVNFTLMEKSSILTLITSTSQDESDWAIFLLLVFWVRGERLGPVGEGDGIFVGGSDHGAGVSHRRSWGLVLDLPIIRHLLWRCSQPLLHDNT